jgi:serpin B
VVRGIRPRCPATRLLDPDPVLRATCEDSLLVLGQLAQDYLLEQRATAGPELTRPLTGSGSESWTRNANRSLTMKYWNWFAAVLFTPLVVSADPPRDEKPQPKIAITADLLKAAADNNRFALDLYAQMRTEQGNLFFSPYSVSTALAMTYVGARGETAAEMAKTLHFTLEPKRLHAAFRDLIQLHRGGKESYQLSVVNALWGQKDYGFLPDFLNATRTNYGAGLHEVDFRRAVEQARQTINAWVEQQTQNKIKDLLQPDDLSPDSRLVLTNAIYFKGAWMVPFSKRNTYDEAFHFSTERRVQTPMMNQTKYCGYMDGGTFQALALPYQRDLSMIVLLPRKVDGLAEFEKTLTAENVQTWLSKMQNSEVIVTLPKFKITRRAQLAKALAAMGMPRAFDRQRADFSGISGSTEGLFIARVIHKAFVDVSEEGTEAAAATAVDLTPKSAAKDKVERPQPPVFRADHPFVFLIRDNRSGSILFIGRLTDPKS